ncbi:MAG TPA: ABC transporter permease [Candidatus Dormibacteraeota bacterium]|nr:ABC transporter permease [Candidatus Dormibacteraeota bacterium]
MGALRDSRLGRITASRAGSLTFFVLRRVLWMVPIVFFVIVITFVLMHLAPGSPWDREGGRQLSAVVVNDLNIKYGLDKPVPQQFELYLWNAAHFDFGLSYQYQGKSVTSLIGGSWAYTATLGVLAFLLIVPVGIVLGVLAALRQNQRADYLTMGFATVAASFPNFVVGALMVVVFAVLMYRATDGNFALPAADFGLDSHLVLPVITLALLPIAYTARLTRASTLEALRQDYVRTAWAKGLSERLVVIRHVLKNSLIPVVTTLGPTFAYLVTGSVIVETVFNIPGIGRAFVVAVTSRDYPMILGTTVLFAVVIAVANLIVDIAYVFIDPRVKVS